MRIESVPEALSGMVSGWSVVRARCVGTGGERRIVSSMQARRRAWVVMLGEVMLGEVMEERVGYVFRREVWSVVRMAAEVGRVR